MRQRSDDDDDDDEGRVRNGLPLPARSLPTRFRTRPGKCKQGPSLVDSGSAGRPADRTVD